MTATKIYASGWDGNACPLCGASNDDIPWTEAGQVLTYGDIAADDGHCWQHGSCQACGGEWDEIYQLLYAEEMKGGAQYYEEGSAQRPRATARSGGDRQSLGQA